MSNPSNLYAEKVFSEHPIALWPLDDVSDYVSLISEEQRDLSSWDISNGSAEVDSSVINEPFPESVTSKVTAVEEGIGFSVSCVSPDLLLMTDLDQRLNTISIGAFVYSSTEFIEGFEIGYEYYDTVSGDLVQDLKFFPTDISKSWIFISETFSPDYQNTAIRLVIKARFFAGFGGDGYNFFVNGITFGQWCEEFHSTSLGTTPTEIIPSIFNTETKAIPAKAYGIQDLSGYYLVEGNSLSAKNTGIPLVFGANNLTSLRPVESRLSLIIPGLGFLNDSGKYKDYTFEFWARISSDTSEERRIFGNIRGKDGLYVRGPFLSLRIGDYVIRHYVGKWYRPMLIHIRISGPSISLLVNGEQVGEVFIDRESLSFPKLTSNVGETTLENDWLGFWSYTNVFPFEIDCLALYGYKVPVQVAKKRFVYGQGVEFPENINNSYSGSSIYIDYPFSKYSKNYTYPSIGKWSQATYDNISIDSNEISFPSYQVPAAQFKTKSQEQWLNDLSVYEQENPGKISLFPNSSWENEDGYILIDNFSIDSSIPKAVYAIIQEDEITDGRQTLFSIQDSVTQSSLDIEVTRNSFDYVLRSFGQSETIASKPRLFSSEPTVLGIDIQKFSDYFGGKAAQLFGRMSSASIFVGGSRRPGTSFRGNILSIGACSKKNLSQMSSVFYLDGTVFSDQFVDGNDLSMVADAGTNLASSAVFDFIYDGGTLGGYASSFIGNHIASYHVSVQNVLSGFKMCIGSKSSWQDYVPLSYFAKNTKDSRGDDRLDLDFIQFNINYPAPSKFVQNESDAENWTYEELKAEYENPVQREYSSLDNQLFTGFENYRDLQLKLKDSYSYDTSASIVKTYITFQILEDGANRDLSSYTSKQSLSKSGIVVPDDSWINTAYEVVDGVIIYPPQSVSFESLALVTHIEMSTLSVEDNPIRIRSLEYASLSLSDSEPTGIGTRFGNDIYPYRKDGFYFTYKSRSPFQIYKESTPYLYLTRDSGITIKGQYDPKVNRGISVPVNSSSSDNYEVIALQLSIRFDQDLFPFAATQIFELQGKNSYMRFYMVASDDTGQRARIYAIDEQGRIQKNIAFYLNGSIVREPYITIKEWSMLGIRFSKPLNFDNYSGAFRITGPLTVNNLSYYKSTGLQRVQKDVERPWYKVKFSGPLTLDWNYWNAVPFLWGSGDSSVLVISSESYYGVDPSDIYKVYTGTNKIIIDNEIPLMVGDYSYKFYNQVLWKSEVYKPV